MLQYAPIMWDPNAMTPVNCELLNDNLTGNSVASYATISTDAICVTALNSTLKLQSLRYKLISNAAFCSTILITILHSLERTNNCPSWVQLKLDKAKSDTTRCQIQRGKFSVLAKILFCITKNLSDRVQTHSEVRYKVMLLTAKHFFSPSGYSIYRDSKVAAYSEANSYSEGSTSDIVKQLSSVCGTSYAQTFCAVCISNMLRPLDSSANNGKEVFAQGHEMQMLSFSL